MNVTNKKLSTGKKFTYDFVKQSFEECGYKLLSTEYKNCHTHLEYICPKHPNVVQEIEFNELRRGRRCPYCMGVHKYTIDEARQIFLDKKGYILLENTYKNDTTPMRYRCPNHPDKDDLKISLLSILQGQGCKHCRSDNMRLTYDEVKSRFDKAGLILVSKVYTDWKTKLQYICPKHPNVTQEMSVNDLTNGFGCKLCHESKGEKAIREWLLKKNIEFIPQYSFDDCRSEHNRLLYFDFYLPDMNVLIEYDGRFHFEAVSEKEIHIKELEEQQKRDTIKNKYCKDNNITLLRINYKQYKREPKNIERILNESLK